MVIRQVTPPSGTVYPIYSLDGWNQLVNFMLVIKLCLLGGGTCIFFDRYKNGVKAVERERNLELVTHCYSWSSLGAVFEESTFFPPVSS